MKLSLPALVAVIAAIVSSCGMPEPAGPSSEFQAPNIDGAILPASGIVGVKGVSVTEKGADKLELVAFAEHRYKMQQVMAVLWCRAREEARRRNYDGWYAVSFRQAFSGSGNQRQAGIGLIQLFRGAPPPGKETLRQQKNWCMDAPASARNS